MQNMKIGAISMSAWAISYYHWK